VHLRARYWRIVAFFGRVTATFIAAEILAPRVGLGAMARRGRAGRNRRIAARFRVMAIRMGGLMIKVGQFLSARLDVLPPEITEELAGLQDEVPAETYQAVRAQAEAEMGRPLAESYVSFEEAPLAAASLGQVHRARLLPEVAAECGFTDVVVKVQRPHIEEIVDVDLAALRRVAGWLKRYKPISERADVGALVEEFASTTRQEIDYVAEGGNAETFAEDFDGDPRIHVPRVVWSLTSRRALTLEDVSAIKITDYDAITAAGIDRSEVAAVLLDSYMRQIIEDGFFHADPHPGNLFVTPAGAGGGGAGGGPGAAASVCDWRLTFVDFGMVGRVPDNLRVGLREALISIATQDGARLVQSFKTLDVLLPTADLKLIELASMQLFDRFGGMSISDLRGIDHSEMMSFGLQFQDLMLEMPFQLPENLLMLGRTVAILSGMCSGLDPEFNLWTSIAPYANDLIQGEGGGTWGTILEEGTKIFQVLIGLPARTDRVLTTIERGELSVQTPMLDLRVRRLERTIGRVSGAIVFAGMLIAGAVLYPANSGLAEALMGASVLPLLWTMLSGRNRHPGR
jgi:predicted unusual protein kinase regulating ubiquinone biosynthesis (AarF/ABC1/UbiB family)